MTGATDAVRLLRERAASYASDAAKIMHEGRGDWDKDWVDDWLVMVRLRDELRRIANEIDPHPTALDLMEQGLAEMRAQVKES